MAIEWGLKLIQVDIPPLLCKLHDRENGLCGIFANFECHRYALNMILQSNTEDARRKIPLRKKVTRSDTRRCGVLQRIIPLGAQYIL